MKEQLYEIVVYTMFNTRHSFGLMTHDKAKEYAKRIITEGFWRIGDNEETFLPVHQVFKVKIVAVL